MSLLIKALDQLDKSKQAEKSKKRTGEYVADESLMLALVPVETQSIAKQGVAEKLAGSDDAEPTLAAKALATRALTLEEEAGLTGTSFTSKHTKQKVTEIAAAQVRVTKNSSSNEAQKLGANNTVADQAKAPVPFQTAQAERNQKAAAKVFVANKELKAPSSKSVLLFLGVAGALLVWLGLQGYGYVKTLSAPEVVVAKPSLPISPQLVAAASTETPTETAVISPTESPANSQPVVIDNATNAKVEVNSSNALDDKAGNKSSIAAFNQKVVANAKVHADAMETEPKKPRTQQISNSDNEGFVIGEDANNAELAGRVKHQAVTLISKAPSLGVDPTLLEAYQALTRGDNATAQQQYRQVLQRDVRNVDALLGMAVIAQKQSRDADAAGWYQKVLEIEPRNTIALSGITGAGQPASNDPIGAESRIKNMLAQQPDAAHLHAALGNNYAEQNQWASAQEAYFNASRLAPNNADYAFNLAISLEQMGKSNLALKQYQRTLELLNKSGATSPDRATLEARINVLQ